jgi:Trk K+ transport system NAD-binding subunit/mannitol/fructose-specific phosphotransferase system IIA component (Ntr-type)
MGYVTQAGVGLGLAKEVAVAFPDWGAAFATMMISVIVLNQLAGPPLFKWAIYLAGEVQPRLAAHAVGGVRDAVIFGLDGESLALARLLQSNGWEVKIATNQDRYAKHAAAEAETEIHPIDEVNLETLKRLGAGQADAIVAMLSDEENFRICELAHEAFSTQHLVVRLSHGNHARQFHRLGAMVVEPRTAVVNLLDQFVRSPSAATLLMGLEKDREVIEFELRNRDLQGFAVRDLMLPLDIHIISIRRHGEQIVSGGFTRLRFGDWLTVVGSRSSLEQMMLQFGENRQRAVMNMVGRAAPREMTSGGLEKEVREISCGREGDLCRVRYNTALRDSTVLDLDEPMDVDRFFRIAADALARSIGRPAESIYPLLVERERESSTVLRPDLAIPHIIFEGTGHFHILLVRCKPGIHFSELAPAVTTVFVLAGTRDQREHHLYALSSIAKSVQHPQFQERWLRARNQWALRNIVQV